MTIPRGGLASGQWGNSQWNLRGARVQRGRHLTDPAGLDRTELLSLAEHRLPISNFDPAKLKSGGFLVRVGDSNVTLPDGTLVQRGDLFRDSFHLSAYASWKCFPSAQECHPPSFVFSWFLRSGSIFSAASIFSHCLLDQTRLERVSRSTADLFVPCGGRPKAVTGDQGIS